MCVCIIVHNCHTQYTQNSSDYFPSKPQDNHHSSDTVFWRGAGTLRNIPIRQNWEPTKEAIHKRRPRTCVGSTSPWMMFSMEM